MSYASERNSDLPLDLRIKFAEVDVVDAKEYMAQAATDSRSTRANRMLADLEVEAAEWRLGKLLRERDRLAREAKMIADAKAAGGGPIRITTGVIGRS